MDRKKRPKFSALENTHVVSLGKIALKLDRALSALTYHTNDVTQHVTEKYWIKKAHS